MRRIDEARIRTAMFTLEPGEVLTLECPDGNVYVTRRPNGRFQYTERRYLAIARSLRDEWLEKRR